MTFGESIKTCFSKYATFGGRMVHYEGLIQTALDQALADLDAKAKDKGYDGVLGVKISHPSLVDGGVEVIVYGNGCRA